MERLSEKELRPRIETKLKKSKIASHSCLLLITNPLGCSTASVMLTISNARPEKITDDTIEEVDAVNVGDGSDKLNEEEEAIETAMEGMTFGDADIDDDNDKETPDEINPLSGYKNYCVKNI